MGLASAWLVTTSMAYYSIRQGLVLTSQGVDDSRLCGNVCIVTFRVLSDYGPTSRLQPEHEKSITIAWACWVVPLAVTEMIFHETKRGRGRVQALQHLHAERTVKGQRG